MRIVILVARLLLGSLFLFFGLNGLLQFFEPPKQVGPGAEFVAALEAAKYVIPTLAVVEILAGAMLISGVFVPLALILLAPIVVNILGFHLALERMGLEVALGVTLIGLFLAYAYRDSYYRVLRPTAKPTGME